MLHCQWLDSKYEKCLKSGIYIDFFLKKLVESFVRNVFVSAAFIIGEKYIIEHITKSMGDKIISVFSNSYSLSTDNKILIVYSFFTFILYMIGLSFLYYILFI